MSSLTLQALATEARSHFGQKTRTDDSTVFWCLADQTPDWVRELVHAAHGEMSPDDYRYAYIVESLDLLAECDDPDDIQVEPDVYTHELCAWLGSRADRYYHCDEAREELGLADDASIINRIQAGQINEREEVLASVRSSLESRLASLATD